MQPKDIQIIGYRKGVDKKSGKPYVYQQHFDQIGVSSIVKLFENLDEIVSLIPEKDQYDCHFTVANCHRATADKSVPLRLFAYQEAIPIDLDGIDLTKKEEYIKIVCEELQIDRNKTYIGCSGNGLHFVIAMTQPIETGEELHRLKAHYKAICTNLNIQFFNSGLMGHADPVRLAEAATLRLPNTLNTKDPENHVRAYVIQGKVEPQPFYLDRLVDVEEEVEEAIAIRHVDSKAILSGCSFLEYSLTHGADMTEPQWYAMLGTLSFIPETGINLCHTYSSKHADYSFEDTQAKAEQALGFGKPRTCESIHQVYAGCAQCPHFKKVKTPLSIRSEEFISTEFTGFHTILSGDPPKTVPNYEDLLRYFRRQHTYVVNKRTLSLWIFNGKHWQEMLDAEVDGFATTNFKPIANNTKRNEFKGLLFATNLVDEEFFTKDNAGYINFSNGVLRLADRSLMPHTEAFGFIYVLPYDYNPDAVCPEFDQLMDNVTKGQKDLQTLLLEFVGYAISGRRASYGAKALILTGGGSNGKSTFLNVIKMLIGRNCYSAVSLEDMSNANARYSMVGKLFNICEEVDDDELKKGTAIFKSITAGAELMVKKLYADVTPMRIDSKIILACNDLPTSKENTYAIYRRMLIVPFKALFAKHTTGVDKGIEHRIEKEMSGVYNRVLDAYDAFVKRDGEFTEAVASTKALEEYKYNNSIFNQFADSCLEKGNDDDFFSSDEIMSAFNGWAALNNVAFRPTSQKLIKELRILGLVAGDSVTRRIGGVVKRGVFGVKRINGAF